MFMLVLTVAVLAAALLYRFGVPAAVGLLLAGALSGPVAGVRTGEVAAVHEILRFGALLLAVLLAARWRTVVPVGRAGGWPVVAASVLPAAILFVVGAGALILLWGVAVPEAIFTGLVVAGGLGPATYEVLANRSERTPGEQPDLLHAALGGAGFVLLLYPILYALGTTPGGAADTARIYVLVLHLILVAFLIGRHWVPGLVAHLDVAPDRVPSAGAMIVVGMAPFLVATWLDIPLVFGAIWAGLLLSEVLSPEVVSENGRTLRWLTAGGFLLALGMALDVPLLVEEGLLPIVLAATLGLIVLRIGAGLVLRTLGRQWSGVPELRLAGLIPMGGISVALMYEGRMLELALGGLEVGGEQVVLAVCAALFVVTAFGAAGVSAFSGDEGRNGGGGTGDDPVPGARPPRAVPAETGPPGEEGPADPDQVFLGPGDESSRLWLVPIEASSAAAGREIGELELKDRYEINALGIWRGDLFLPGDGGQAITLRPDDLLVLAGSGDRLERSLRLFTDSDFPNVLGS